MRPRIVQQASQAWAASSLLQFKLGSQTFWPTGIAIGFETAYTVSTPTAAQDWLARQISAYSVFGKKTYVSGNFRDARAQYWSTRFVSKGRFRMPDFQNAATTVYHWLFIPFNPAHYYCRPDGSFDVTCIQAARQGKRILALEPDSTFELDLTTTAASSPMGTTGITQTSSSKFRPYLVGIEYDQDNDFDNAHLPWGYPKIELLSATPDQTYSGEGWKVKLAQGAFLMDTTVLTLKGAVTSSGDVRDSGYGTNSISEISVLTSDGRKPLDAKAYDLPHIQQSGFFVSDDNSDVAGATLAGGASVITDGGANMGAYHFPWATMADSANFAGTPDNPLPGGRVDPDFGLDFRSTQDTAVRLAETVDTTTTIVQALLHREALPY